jgi:hypothetical protein
MTERQPICGMVILGGPNGEPLACGYPPNPDDQPMHSHSWASLPTWNEGRFVSRRDFIMRAPSSLIARIAVWRMLGGNDDDLEAMARDRHGLSIAYCPSCHVDARSGWCVHQDPLSRALAGTR